jgi:hypothetical protein
MALTYNLMDVFLLGAVVTLPVAVVVIAVKWYQGEFSRWEQD